ncbi:uncharacterized protein LY89DRAFT_636788 [Mollisia scopiformis]|uniref:Uncharacterized protein n=1 Tax=Mollisia scopiformis TaxID=149040 RepID=A0A194XS96_MOLSC|nr:uncharacterized protein LY89DRAFT_636788 [Mollisia scopiformis]KUJ22602.1 hypothetical protein LY89DRAFT_636788 [Mollisia scopiformis]
MSWKDPRTASPENSIWLNLPEDTFRQHLVELEAKTNSIPMDPQVFSPDDWLSTSARESEQPHILPLATEQQIADDFAFLAAVTEGAQSVAAVCLEERHSPTPSLTLRFATLDSLLNSNIKDGLQSILQILIEHASNSTTTNPPVVEKLLEIIIKLHHPRLLARLRSTKWSKPTYLSKSHKKPLYADIPNLLHRLSFLFSKSEKALLATIKTNLQTLHTLYSTFETLPSSTDHSSLHHLITTSCTILNHPSTKQFSQRLVSSQKTRKPTPQVASALKTLRQIEKIASYRRVATSLLKASTTYRSLFSNLRIAFLAPYTAIPTTIAYESWAKTLHVHAEVQLAVFYDLQTTSNSSTSPDAPRPRAIGTSKWLCYLCYRFLVSHGRFFPSKTHGRVFDQWTVPDLVEYGDGVRERYRGVVREVDEVVRRESGEIGEGVEEGWRLMPMTSVDLGPWGEEGMGVAREGERVEGGVAG